MTALNEDLKRIYALLQGGRRLLGRAAPLHRPRGFLQLRQLDAVSHPDRQCLQRQSRTTSTSRRPTPRASTASSSSTCSRPNRLNFLTHGNTLVEEHIAGVPGDIFIDRWLRRARAQAHPHREGTGEVQRALLRPPARRHAQLQLRRRPHAGLRGRAGAHPRDGLRPAVLPRPEELLPAAVLQGERRRSRSSAPSTCNPQTALQYQREEQTLMLQRAELAAARLAALLDAMVQDPIAPEENVRSPARGPGGALPVRPLPPLRIHGRAGARKSRDAAPPSRPGLDPRRGPGCKPGPRMPPGFEPRA